MWRTLADMLGDGSMVLRVYMVGMKLTRGSVEGGESLKFCDEGELCMANTWFKKEQRKMACRMGGGEAEIDFVLVGKNNRRRLKDVKAILW